MTEAGSARRTVLAFATSLMTSTALITGGALLLAPAALAQQSARSFDIPAQPLAGALNAFGRQSGLQVSLASGAVEGLTSTAVSGSHPVDAALGILLSGTGLPYSITADGTALVGAPATLGDLPDDGSIILEEVNVTAWVDSAGSAWDGSGETVYSTPGSVAHISAETIEQFRGTGSGDIFKSTTGVIATSNHNGASVDVNIRGLQGQNRVKVTIDGTQQSTSTWRGYLGVDDRTYLDADLIGGVSIEKGPTGTAAGAGVTGGVVAIRTISADDIVKDGNEFGARVRIGTSDNAIEMAPVNSMEQRTEDAIDGLVNGSASGAFAIKTENFDFVTAVAMRKSGNYFAGSKGPSTYINSWGSPYPLSYTKPGEEVFNSSEDTVSALMKATWRWDDHTLQLGYTRFDSEFGEAMGSLLTTQENTFRQVSLATAKVDSYTARYRWDPEDDLINLRANLWATNVDSVTRSVGPAFYLPPWITPETRPPADDPRASQTWTFGGDITNTSLFDVGVGTLALDYGASYTLEDMDGQPYLSRIYANDTPVLQKPSVGTREIASTFINGKWDINDWLTATGGLRYDAYRVEDHGGARTSDYYNYVFTEKSGGRWNPSVGLTVTPVEGLQLFALYNEGLRPPSLRESVGSDSNLAPNFDLRPEHASNWEAGINYASSGLFTADDTLGLKVSYFDNTTYDYISRVNNPDGGPGKPFYSVANLYKANFKGVELSGRYDAGVFFAEASYTHYLDFGFCTSESSCISDADSSDYAINHAVPEYSRSLTLGTRMFDDESLTIGTRIIQQGPRMGPVPAIPQQTNMWVPYTVVDAFLEYEVTDNVTLSLNAENIFDRYYIDAMDGWMPAPGRTISATLTGSF